MSKESSAKKTAFVPQIRIRILKSSDAVLPYLDEVSKVADRYRKELGFLPDAVYAEQAAHSHLWIAADVSVQRVAGFLSYGGTFPNLRIFQLFVAKYARRMGIGKSLVQELITFGEKNNFLTATAKVAAELPANSFWERNGFRIVDQVRGGNKSKGRLINVRLRELDSLALFKFRDTGTDRAPGTGDIRFSQGPSLSNHTYVLDLNVFFDAIRQRLNRESAQRVIAAALANDIRVLVTPEFSQELERHTIKGSRDPVLEFSRTLPTLPPVESDLLHELSVHLRTMIFPNRHESGKDRANDISDVLHLAYCIHHGVTGFLTGEKAILRCSEELSTRYGIEVLAPSDLIDIIGTLPYPTERRTVMVSGQSGFLSVGRLEEHNRAEAEAYLKRMGLLPAEIAAILDPGTSVTARVRLIATVDQAVIGIASWSPKNSDKCELIAHIYVDEASSLFERVLDHFVECVQRERPNGELKRIGVWSKPGWLKTRETLFARGFRPAGDNPRASKRECYIKVSLKGPLAKSCWSKVSTAFFNVAGQHLPHELPSYSELLNTGLVLKARNNTFPLVASLFDFETLISPGFLLASGRQAVLVPIREAYARSLIGLHAPQLELLPSPEALLRLEKAYFLTPGRHHLFGRGTLIIFYVSGAGGGRKQAIGIARTTFSDTITVEQALLSLVRQGVLPETELRERAGVSGRLTAVTFDNFLAFPNPVSYSALKQLRCISGANLVTAEKLSFRQLEKILSRAF